MTFTREQITSALAIIKTTCNESNDCEICPFRIDKDDCYINNEREIYPFEWDINDEDNWSAFR
jgi:hypothetical protein